MPKGVPLETGQRNLAVHVEDHPLDYAGFEGEIPKGQYGAGTVEIWDSGTYELLEEKPDGGLTVRLDGERLQGVWTLVPAHLSGEEKNWLILRKRDDTPAKARGKRTEYAPMLATLAEDVPAGKGWSFEVKFDGYRALAYVRGSEARLVSRNGNDLTARFESVARALQSAIKTPDCVLDGEVCALDEQGRSSFSAMQQGSGAIVYYVFDILEVEGTPVVDRPLEERRAELVRLLDRRNRTVLLSEAFDDGPGSEEGGGGAGTRGHRRQEGRLTLRAGPPLPQLAQDQGARPPGVHRRRLHPRQGPAVGDARLTRPRRQRRERPRVRRQRRHGLHGEGDRQAPR